MSPSSGLKIDWRAIPLGTLGIAFAAWGLSNMGLSNMGLSNMGLSNMGLSNMDQSLFGNAVPDSGGRNRPRRHRLNNFLSRPGANSNSGTIENLPFPVWSLPMPRNLKPLTALRFFAAMWVVAYQFWPALGRDRPMLLTKGYLGVDLFFILSGFILCHVYLPCFGERRFSYREFLWARLARIYPTHIVTLIGFGALVYVGSLVGVRAGGNVLVWPSLPAQLTLTQAWGLGPLGGWNHPAWSISAEWFAYLCFPAFVAATWAGRGRPRLSALAAFALAIGFEIGFQRVVGLVLTDATILWGAARILPPFAIGCGVYLLWSSQPLRTPAAAVAVIAASLAAALISMGIGAPDWVAIVLFGGLIYGLAGLSSAGASLLSGGVWVYLGEVSFALYMIAVPWGLAFDKGLHRLLHLPGETLTPAMWWLQYLGALPAAIVLHHLVERPAREAMRRWGAPFSRRRSSTNSTPAKWVASGSPRRPDGPLCALQSAGGDDGSGGLAGGRPA
jgi:peptidoglycan/LPS O-acetylase OafA/YrhL